jgi:hypothetical protein
MLIRYFIQHQWRQTTRSTIWQRSLALNIFMAFIFSILFAEVLIASIFIADKWHEIVEGTEPLFAFYKVIAWYFASMLVMRFLMQQLPVLEVGPYLHLPLKKSMVLHFILTKGSLNFFTLISIVFFTPFAFFQIAFYHGSSLALLWLLSMLVLDLTLNYFIVYLKKQLVGSLKLVIGILLIIGILALGDYLGWYSYSTFVANLIQGMVNRPVFIIFPLALFLIVYGINYRFLSQNLYLEDLSSYTSRSQKQYGELGYLKQFGIIGEIINIDVKMYLRNKRTKSMLVLSPLFLAYGLIFYTQPEYSKDSGMMIFVGVFMTGIMMVNYLQYAFANEGSYFDLLLTSGIDFRDYIKAKFTTASTLVIVSFILTIPYYLFGKEIFYANTACFLFNLGISIPVALYSATYNKKAINLKKGSAFNYQGVGASHWLFLIPFFIGPLVIYLPFKWFVSPEAGWAALGLVGLIMLAFRSFFAKAVYNNLQARKYIMATGFRERY